LSFPVNNQVQSLFNRQYSVTIGAPTTYTIPLAAPPVQSLKSYTTLRTTFDIDKNSAGSANTSKIELYGLSTQSRQLIKKGWVVILTAGYEGIQNTIFEGNVVNVYSKRSEQDIITTMECMDGGSSLTYGIIAKPYPAGTPLTQMLSDLAKAMNLTIGFIGGIPQVTYDRGTTLFGSVKDNLNTLLKPLGMKWYIQNGKLYVLPLVSVINPTAIVVSVETGMIGVPSDNNQFIQFTSLLNPGLMPSTYVKLISENTDLNGFYSIRRSHFEGDSHESKWQVSCECIKAPNVAPIAVATTFQGAA
jgi:hypothetical protein